MQPNGNNGTPLRDTPWPARLNGTGGYHHSSQHVPFATAFVQTLTAPLRWLMPPATSVRRAACEDWCDAADESLADAAQGALHAEDVGDLSELLTDFTDDLDTLRFLTIDQDATLVTEPVERHPIAYLYARRVAQLAGVAVADDEEARRAYVAAREACEWLAVAMEGWSGGGTSLA